MVSWLAGLLVDGLQFTFYSKEQETTVCTVRMMKYCTTYPLQ